MLSVEYVVEGWVVWT